MELDSDNDYDLVVESKYSNRKERNTMLSHNVSVKSILLTFGLLFSFAICWGQEQRQEAPDLRIKLINKIQASNDTIEDVGLESEEGKTAAAAYKATFCWSGLSDRSVQAFVNPKANRAIEE